MLTAGTIAFLVTNPALGLGRDFVAIDVPHSRLDLIQLGARITVAKLNGFVISGDTLHDDAFENSVSDWFFHSLELRTGAGS